LAKGNGGPDLAAALAGLHRRRGETR